MNRGTEHAELTPDGFAFLCDCGTTTLVTLVIEGAPQDGHEMAVTCEGCQSVHWFTLHAGPAAP